MICSRCLQDSAGVVAKAPDGSGAWEVIYCGKCNFSWRTSDEDEYINTVKRDRVFQLDASKLEALPTMMPVTTPRKD